MRFDGIVTTESVEDGGKALICSLAGLDEAEDGDGMFVMLQSWCEHPTGDLAVDHPDLARYLDHHVSIDLSAITVEDAERTDTVLATKNHEGADTACGKVWLPHGRPGAVSEVICILDEGHFGDCSTGHLTLNPKTALFRRYRTEEEG